MEPEVKDKLPEEIAESLSTTEICRFTRSMARNSETGACLTDLLILNTERVIRLTNKVYNFIHLFFCNRWQWRVKIQRRCPVSTLLIHFPLVDLFRIYFFLIVFVLFFQADAFRLKASSGSGNQHTEEETISSKEVSHGMSISDYGNAAHPPK